MTRDKPFDAVVEGQAIAVTPGSRQTYRIRRSEFERIAPMIVAGKGPGDLAGETFGASYVEAIVHYIRRRG